MRTATWWLSAAPAKTPKYPADRGRSYVEIEREARRTRRMLGFEMDEPLPSLPLFESIAKLRTGKRAEIPTTYEVTKLVVGVEAQTSYSGSPEPEIVVALSEETYIGLEADLPRPRYTVAHETGHAVQHFSELVRLSRIPHAAAALLRGNFEDLPVYQDVEWQANAFAGALLMPATALAQLEQRGRLTLTDVCKRFNTSGESTEIRLRTYRSKKEQLLRVK